MLLDMAAVSTPLSARSASAALLLVLMFINGNRLLSTDAVVIARETATRDQQLNDSPTAAKVFSPVCRAAACGGKINVKIQHSQCVFARLSPDRPAFALVANPKASSTSLRIGLRELNLETMFERRCSIDRPLESEVLSKLGVTGWEEISALVVVRQPMDRFISGWEEITMRASLSVGKPLVGRNIAGFEFLRDEENMGPVLLPDVKAGKALRRVRTADNFERYLTAYLDLVEKTDDLLWHYDPHASMQVVRMGVCSQLPVRDIVIVKIEDMAVGIPNFLVTHANATEDRDGVILKALRNPPHHRPAAYKDILDVRELVQQDRFKTLWEKVKHSRFMIADHICAGYTDAVTIDIP